MMVELVKALMSFTLLALAAREVGRGLRWVGLPLLSGFLFAGIVAGPHSLGFLEVAEVDRLRFIDQFSLAFIAFAAGGELELVALRSSLGSIVAIIIGSTCVVLTLGALAFYLLADLMPFMHSMAAGSIIAVALLGGTIMVARSPSSVYAIIKELRARGPFTQVVLGVTVLIDAVVIILFAINVTFADVLSQGARFNIAIVLLLFAEIALDLLLGVLVSQVLRGILALPWPRYLKTAGILTTGYTIYFLATRLHDVHLGPLPVGIFSEPMLIGLVAGFVVVNFTRDAAEFRMMIEEAAPIVFLLFFTLVGLSLDLSVIAQTWGIAVVLLLIRLIGLHLGSFFGSRLIGHPARQDVFFSMSFITQAGVSIGLAKEVALEFPPWGEAFATLIIAVIVMNQLIGPPFFKWALHLAGETHTRAEQPEFDGMHDVVIFGIDEQSLALARQLKAHNWEVRLADTEPGRVGRLVWPGVEARLLPALTVEALRGLEIEKAEAIVAMLDDESNYTICELAYEHFGTANLVARVYDRRSIERFHTLGVMTVDTSTALVNLLDHYVRSRSATSLLLGQELNQDVLQVTVGNRALHGMALRDLHLPSNTLILSVRRRGQLLLSHGYTRLELGDEVTIVGNNDSLEELQWRFEPFPYS
jgi:Trk K+ transport system NAD-binding subunit/Kef-type K+ transport system membrane component KefB